MLTFPRDDREVYAVCLLGQVDNGLNGAVEVQSENVLLRHYRSLGKECHKIAEEIQPLVVEKGSFSSKLHRAFVDYEPYLFWHSLGEKCRCGFGLGHLWNFLNMLVFNEYLTGFNMSI